MALYKIQPEATGDIFYFDSASTILKSDGTNFVSASSGAVVIELSSASTVEILDVDALTTNTLSTATVASA